jgi:DNA polymerase
MNLENFDIRAVLEFYMNAGVDVTCGEKPVSLMSALTEPVHKPLEPAETATLQSRPGTSHLALDTNQAVKSADDVCAKATNLDELRKIVESFDGCNLKNTASHTVLGDGNPQARIVFVGEAPGADEDRIGRPFVGKCGQLLDKMLAAIGLDRTVCYICNVLPWRPPGNRSPSDAEIAVCLPFLKRQIELVNPDYLCVLGAVAAKALLGTEDTISKLRGKWMVYENAQGKPIQALASYHPSYLLRTPAQKSKSWADFLRLKKTLDENN